MFVGDVSEGDIKVVKKINLLSIPSYVILGNHDRGKDKTGETLRKQIRLLNEKYCAWDLKVFNNYINILGGRPCSSGGGYYLSKEVLALYGPITEDDSVKKIIDSYKKAKTDLPLLIISHTGPSGLGSEPNSICGRDWKKPSLDWGDRDLSIAITKIQKERLVDLVVFGHMHNQLNRNLGRREMFVTDRNGTSYLNAAIVPRYTRDASSRIKINFSWVEFKDKKLSHVSQRWYSDNGQLEKENILFEINHKS